MRKIHIYDGHVRGGGRERERVKACQIQRSARHCTDRQEKERKGKENQQGRALQNVLLLRVVNVFGYPEIVYVKFRTKQNH